MKAADIVMQSYGRCCASDGFFDSFYDHFLATSPEVRDKFANTNMAGQKLLLRQGTPEQVREGVKSLLDTMAPGGGFILGPSHKLKVETPIENVIEMYKEAHRWKYKK